MKSLPPPPSATDDQVRALLERYACPVPFHEVRTRFLGNIASPVMEASPVDAVKGLWGGDLPEFDSREAANGLIGALVMGLWNRLTHHQERATPFRLTRGSAPATLEGVRALALMRSQELDGFVEGFFARREVMDVPERAHRSFDILGEIRGLLVSVQNMTADETTPAMAELNKMLRHLHEMTRIAEHEIHAVVLSCTRARRQMLARLPMKKPTLH